MRTIAVALANIQCKGGEWVVLHKGDPLLTEVTAEEVTRLDAIGALTPDTTGPKKSASQKPDKEG